MARRLREHPPPAMLIAGVEVSDSAAARLAVLLHRAGENTLAMHIGYSVDHLRDEARIVSRDHTTILAVLEDPPEDLAELRAALLRQQTARVQDML